MLNLYNLHSNPSALHKHEVADEQLPFLARRKYWNNDIELKRREYLWKKDAECAYCYAYYVIKRKWAEGEAIIATDAENAYHYARNIIKGRWSEGEDAIKRMHNMHILIR